MTTIDVEPTFSSVDALLSDARSRLRRVSPPQAAEELSTGAMLVDIRPGWQRAREGEIPGALIVERNHLEWRLHPRSDARVPYAIGNRRWIVVCSEGYTSSLAADALRSLGIDATDLIGGFHAWRAAGLPTIDGPSPVGGLAGSEPSVDLAELSGADIEYEAAH
jgi:rhodanese-related sulfurtransferase